MSQMDPKIFVHKTAYSVQPLYIAVDPKIFVHKTAYSVQPLYIAGHSL